MFGQRLAQLRRQQGLSQSELARRAGLTSQAVNQLERGKRWPRAETFQKLATALKVEPAELLRAA